MPAIALSTFGNILLCLLLVTAAYTFAVAILAGRGRPHLLPAARWGTLATSGLVLAAVLVLAYAFQTHDFRIRYVSRYSDRSMSWVYLLTALWGGQDGSLLWWTFILSAYTTAAVTWMKGKYRELQPWVLATLATIFLFFTVTMLFAANPFAENLAGAPRDGEGLNPLLQNYWMAIHPPMLYAGLVGWSVPFGFVIAALITGRLREEWIHASRKWVLFAWLALTVGNMLGMLWSYEELGWGGYWAWDPVENASFMPWLLGTAYLHSIMIQERRGMLKGWNVFLLCGTFTLTIFGTFLTRSGLIASVHSFAKSEIGTYFLIYLALLVAAWSTLIFARLPLLREEGKIDSILSREFAFTVNNWILLFMLVFVCTATLFPKLSELVRSETVTVGAGFYNKWMTPLGLILLFLTGVGPLIAWRKATGSHLLRAFVAPSIAGAVIFALHLGLGARAGYPPVIEAAALYETATGAALAAIDRVKPLVSTTLCAFVLGCIVQEFWRGTRARMKSTQESVFVALVEMTTKAKRRYGGYLVHVGIVLAFLGFTGAAYDIEKEAALKPGESMSIAGYRITYEGARFESDANKRMVLTDLSLSRGGREVARMAPAKFIYRALPDMPTTEVSIRSDLGHDLYVIMNSVNTESRLATFKVLYRPFVSWIWVAGLVMILGSVISLSPTVKDLLPQESRVAKAGVAIGIALVCCVPAIGRAQDSSSLHAGHVAIENATEKRVFDRLLCMCGDCQRLPLSTCACGWADHARQEVRDKLARGVSPTKIESEYRAEHGPSALAIPADRGLDRALWVVPIAGGILAMGLLARAGLRWARKSPGTPDAATSTTAASEEERAYDEKLEEELRKLEDA